jgi:hypothetical protein
VNDKKRKIILIIDKMKSSVKNKYCLFCRSEIKENNHSCEEIENVGNNIVTACLKFEISKEILEEFNDDLLKNEEFAQNIKNKLIAYNI